MGAAQVTPKPLEHKHLGVHRCHGSPETLRAWRSFRGAERAQLTLPVVPAIVPRSETCSASSSSPPGATVRTLVCSLRPQPQPQPRLSGPLWKPLLFLGQPGSGCEFVELGVPSA